MKDLFAGRREAERAIMKPLGEAMSKIAEEATFESEIPCPKCKKGTKFVFMNPSTGTVIRKCEEGTMWAALDGSWEELDL